MSSRDSDWEPFSQEIHDQQVGDLLSLLGPAPKRVLDLGAGSGRIAVPLQQQGHTLLAVESVPLAVTQLQQQSIHTVECDFLEPGWDAQFQSERFDAITMLGNTFMLVHQTSQAMQLFQILRTLLDADGMLVLDAIPQLHWPEVADGNWQNGISQDDQSQLLWASDDNVFVFRQNQEVDTSCDGFKPTDRLQRLWTMGELSLLAHATGWTMPVCSPSRTMLFFRRS